MPRSFEHIFYNLNRLVKENDFEYLAKCSYLEIYNEQIQDLLDPLTPVLKLRESMERGVYVEAAIEEIVTSAAQMSQIIKKGTLNRHISSTKMNENSSRSHAVMTLRIEIKKLQEGLSEVTKSSFHIVDLAGSERASKTGAEGMVLEEAKNIIENECHNMAIQKYEVEHENSELKQLIQDLEEEIQKLSEQNEILEKDISIESSIKNELNIAYQTQQEKYDFESSELEKLQEKLEKQAEDIRYKQSEIDRINGQLQSFQQSLIEKVNFQTEYFRCQDRLNTLSENLDQGAEELEALNSQYKDAKMTIEGVLY